MTIDTELVETINYLVKNKKLEVFFQTYTQTPDCGIDLVYEYLIDGESVFDKNWFIPRSGFFEVYSENNADVGVFTIEIKMSIGEDY